MILKNKIAIVTGASKGIGNSIANTFAKEGAIVYALSRTETKRTCDTIIPKNCDITDSAQVLPIMTEIKKTYGHVDILVNNAGVMDNSLLGMITHKTMLEQFEINVFAPILLTQLVLKLMRKQKSGSIINLASIIGVRGHEGQTVYSASKGAIISFTLSASKELAEDGIRVNAISPGTIETDLLKSISNDKLQEHLKAIRFGRVGKPEEVANLATFLASDYSSYITGQIIGIDGGTIICLEYF